MDDGCVTRAYAWAGETIWNQGAKTLAESRLDMKCAGYGEEAGDDFLANQEKAAENVEKIPLLAARWSLDPEILHRAGGIAGGYRRALMVAGAESLKQSAGATERKPCHTALNSNSSSFPRPSRSRTARTPRCARCKKGMKKISTSFFSASRNRNGCSSSTA